MKTKGYGWPSEYRRQKFLNSHTPKKSGNALRPEGLNLPLEPKRYNAIAVMLDLDGTSNNIDDEKARMFVQQLDVLRRKFYAETCYISISTQYGADLAPSKIRGVLDILSKHLTKQIKIGTNFYLEGTYDYTGKQMQSRNPQFNIDKVATFTECYFNRFDFKTAWFALIDDNLDKNTYRRFQDDYPMLVARPSQRDCESGDDNFMSLETATFGFDGVLEMLANYIEHIASMSPTEILENQQNIPIILSKRSLREKIMLRDFSFLESYVCEGRAPSEDYSEIVERLVFVNDRAKLTLEELEHIEKILKHIAIYYVVNNQGQKAGHVIRLQEAFKKNSGSK